MQQIQLNSLVELPGDQSFRTSTAETIEAAWAGVKQLFTREPPLCYFLPEDSISHRPPMFFFPEEPHQIIFVNGKAHHVSLGSYAFDDLLYPESAKDLITEIIDLPPKPSDAAMLKKEKQRQRRRLRRQARKEQQSHVDS